jgi:predicted sugar kinase
MIQEPSQNREEHSSEETTIRELEETFREFNETLSEIQRKLSKILSSDDDVFNEHKLNSIEDEIANATMKANLSRWFPYIDLLRKTTANIQKVKTQINASQKTLESLSEILGLLANTAIKNDIATAISSATNLLIKFAA